MATKDERVTKLMLWASLSDSHPVEDLQVFGCAFSEWYVSRLAHMEECDTCREMYGALLRQALEAHHRITAVFLAAATVADVRAKLDALPHTDDDIALQTMPASNTKH